MNESLFAYRRKSFMELGQIYFWTATIHKWQKLLNENRFKDIIIDSLSYLSSKKKLEIFAFVIMPNHVHFIWRILEQNGGETTVGSFLEYTAHELKKVLLQDKSADLDRYRINASNKSYEFWKRDSLAVHVYSVKLLIRSWIISMPIQLQSIGSWQKNLASTGTHRQGIMNKI